MFLASCAIAPGLYSDGIDSPNAPSGPEEPLDIEVISVDSALAAQLQTTRISRSKEKALESHLRFTGVNQQPEDYVYRVGRTDVLSIVSWGQPELSLLTSGNEGVSIGSTESILRSNLLPASGTAHEVDAEGLIYYPFVGALNVLNLTVPEIRQLLIKELKKYIPDPRIDVSVTQFRSQRAYVVGEVTAPAVLKLNHAPLELIDALSSVEGLTSFADLRNAALIREDRRYHIDLQAVLDGDLTQNYVLKNQDVLLIPDNRVNSVFLLGEFESTGRVLVPGNAFFSLADAITDSSIRGFSRDVDSSQVFVFRYGGASEAGGLKPKVFHIDLGSAEAMLVASSFPLQPRDIVYAAPTSLSRWNRLIPQILPTIQATYLAVRAEWYIDEVRNNE